MFKRLIFLIVMNLALLVGTAGVTPAQVQSSTTTPTTDP